MAENDVEIKFGASLEGLQAGIEEAKEQVEGLSGPISGIVDSFKELGEALAAALAVEKIVDFAKEMGELGEATERMSKILGISTEQVGELSYAAAMTGTSTDNLVMMMSRFESGLSVAEKGTGRMAAGLRSLGLSAKELEGVNPSQQLREIAEAVSKVADSTAKTAALADLGRGFAQLIPLLDEGGEGFDELAEKARAAGVVMSPELTAKLVEMQHGMIGLREDIQGATISGFTPFIGAVNVAVGGMSSLTSGFTDSVNHGGLMKQMLDILADGFRIVESAVNDLVASLKMLGAVATYSITVAVDKALELGNTLSAVALDLAHLDPSFSHVAAVAHQGAQDATDAWNEMRKTIASALADNDEAAHKIWKDSPLAAKAGSLLGFHLTDPRTGEAAGVPTGGSDNAFKPPPPMPVEQTAGTKDTAAKDAEQQFSAEVQAAKAAEAEIAEGLEERLKTHQITMAQWLQQSNVALDAEALAVINAADKATAGTALNSEQKKAIWEKEERDLAEIALKEQKDFDKAAQETTKSWMTAGDAIAGTLNSQVNSLLKGTETIAQAFRNMAASIIEDLIKVAIKIAAEAVALEALSLATGGAAGGFGAGGFGGFLAGALHFAEGTNYVPTTGFHHLDQGEAVIPAHLNPSNPANSLSFGGDQRGQSSNSGGGGGDTHHHWGGVNINNTGGTLDPAEVAKAMDKAVRSGAHTGLKVFAR